MAIFTKPLSTNTRKWADLDLDFVAHPVTKDIVLKKDVEAVKRSVRNLVLTNQYEKPFHPEIYSGVRGMLFELMTPTTAIIIARHVEDVIINYEPRARLIGVRAFPNLDRNEYELSKEFYIVNAPTELVTLELALERVR